MEKTENPNLSSTLALLVYDLRKYLNLCGTKFPRLGKWDIYRCFIFFNPHSYKLEK